jgi:hypothetical protein
MNKDNWKEVDIDKKLAKVKRVHEIRQQILTSILEMDRKVSEVKFNKLKERLEKLKNA